LWGDGREEGRKERIKGLKDSLKLDSKAASYRRWGANKVDGGEYQCSGRSLEDLIWTWTFGTARRHQEEIGTGAKMEGWTRRIGIGNGRRGGISKNKNKNGKIGY
jgi:hypothetical protein